MKKTDIMARIESIKYTQSTPGWKLFEEYLAQREVLLMNQMRKGDLDKLHEIRGRLRELEGIKKFLKVELLSGQQILDALHEIEVSNGS